MKQAPGLSCLPLVSEWTNIDATSSGYGYYLYTQSFIAKTKILI